MLNIPVLIGVFVIFTAITVSSSGSAFAQADVLTSKQTTLSENLENDPLAQDILRKIEQSKREIAQIQQKELERNEAKKELEQKRAEALASLQKDLVEWEKLWEEFTFEYRFARQSGMGWDAYNFTNSKILAGKMALKQILDDGGGPEEARQAYTEAAQIKRSELIAVNALLNVRYNLALYNQQILFDADGQFHDIISGDQLRKYYQDYRLDPIYLGANHDDEMAWKEMSRDIQAICRDGHVLVYRIYADDHICVTDQTAELWVLHKMGNILFDESLQSTDTPTIEKFKQDRLNEKVKNINNKIESSYKAYEGKISDMNKKYEALVLETQAEQREEEQKTISESGSASKETLDRIIRDIRDKYAILEESIAQQKIQTMQILESNHKQSMETLIKNFETTSDVKIIWDANESRYEAVPEQSL